MAYISQRGEYWCAQLRKHGYKSVYRTCDTKQQAQQCGLPPDLRQVRASRGEPHLECFGTDAAQMTVAAIAVVKNRDGVKHISASQITGFIDPLAEALFFSGC